MTELREGIFGIDLGTTYSAVAYIDQSGKPVVVRSMVNNSETTPSVVYFENESNVVVGSDAKESAVLAPDQVVSLIKREMGNKEWRKTIFGKEYDPATISALILGALARAAEAETGRKVDKVVITVPAYFGMLEKQATRQAGEIAGLDVVEVVPEPVAAAFAYGIASDGGEKTILVYDLGGGTFDVTIIEITPTSVEVVVVDGDHMLGGADWDAAIFEFLADAAVRELGDDSLLEDPQFVQSLWDQAEEVKQKLSQAESRSVVLRWGGGAAKVAISRSELEQLTAHLLEKTITVTKRALETAEAKAPGITSRLTDVLLVGGSSLMPAASQALKKEFAWDAKLADPHLAVARGAAMYAAGAVARDLIDRTAQESQAVSGDVIDADGGTLPPAVPTEEQREETLSGLADRWGVRQDVLDEIASVKTTGVLPKAIGIKLVDSSIPNWEELLREHGDSPSGPYMVQHLVEPQTPLPHRPAEAFEAQTIVAGQDKIRIELWEQAGGVPGKAMSENGLLPVKEPEACITDLAAYNLPAGSLLEIYFDVSAEGVVTLRAVEPVSGKDLTVTATIALLTDDEVEQAKALYSGLTASA